MAYVLGIDLGTGSLKGILLNKEGEVAATASASYPLLNPQMGYYEQEPGHWVEALEKVMHTLGAEISDFQDKLEAIGFSGQMHSLVLLDEQKNPLRPAILWNDTRTAQECEEITQKLGADLLAISKNIALEGFTLPKILWIQKNEPEIWAKARHILLPKDYLGYYLTKELHTDYSDAAGTLLLDVEKGIWSQKIADAFSIPMSYLPKVVSSSAKVGYLCGELKEKFGFKKDIIICAGGADNACAAVGAGILDEDIAMASIGTSGVFLSAQNSVSDYSGKLHMFNHAAEDIFYAMGVTLAAGYSLDWFKTTFAPNMDFNELLQGIEELKIGGDGLLFAPYIVGERTPHVDAAVRGGFLGIDSAHTIKSFARAVLEGITFSLKDTQSIMEKAANKTFTKVVSVGGGAKSGAWLQMQADVFNAVVVCLKSEQGPGLGAAYLAAVGAGWFKNTKECTEKFVSYTREVHPIPENVEAYAKVYEHYRRVYAALKSVQEDK